MLRSRFYKKNGYYGAGEILFLRRFLKNHQKRREGVSADFVPVIPMPEEKNRTGQRYKRATEMNGR